MLRHFFQFKKNLSYKAKEFKNINVPMREISLSDNDIKNNSL